MSEKIDLREVVARAMYEYIPAELVGGDDGSRILTWEEHQEYFKESPEMSESYRWNAEAAIAAAEPHLRRQHRRELLDWIDLMIKADDDDHPFPPFVYGYAPNGEMLIHLDRILDSIKETEE